MVPFFCEVLKEILTTMMKMFILSGSCKNVNGIVQTKNILQETIQWILQETIQWITDITDTCFTEFFDEEGLHTRQFMK